MKSTKSDIVFHFVWTTAERAPLIRPEMERDLYRLLEAQAREMDVGVLALGGVEDAEAQGGQCASISLSAGR